MQKTILFSLLVILSSIATYASEDTLQVEPFVIEGLIISKDSQKPIEADVTFCTQIGEEIVSLEQSCLTENGRFKLVLPERPNKEIGRYALLVESVRDFINPYTGKPGKIGSHEFITRFVAVEIPEAGNVCVMPDIEMNRVIYQDYTWPYELPAKLIEMEHKESINNSTTN